MPAGYGEWSDAELRQYRRCIRTGPSESWWRPSEALERRDQYRSQLGNLIGKTLSKSKLEVHGGEPTPWPRGWLWRVHGRVLLYHPSYSHTMDARKYYDFSDEELLCSICVKLQLDFEAAMEMGSYELAGVVYDQFRRLRVPEQTEEGPLVSGEE